MRQYEHLQCGTDRLRVAPWRVDSTVAEITSVTTSQPPKADSIQQALRLLAMRGYRAVVTNALTQVESRGYVAAGFTVHERLHLLAHDLDNLPKPVLHGTRRGRVKDRAAVLGVDASAFEPFWRLDERGLIDAITATPKSRVRVNRGPKVSGYAVTGAAGSRGYLQRLAVHPDQQGHGIGSTLVIDCLNWLKRRRCQIAMVNTQEVNEGALRLYQRLGFSLRPGGLAVLRYEFESRQ